MNAMLHIIQNDPEVPPGNIIDHLTIPYAVYHPYLGEPLPDVAEISALIVLGGAMGANDEHKHPFLADLKTLIRHVVESGIPYLGICLGGQLLAAVLGATVASGRWDEIGNFDVSLTERGASDQLFRGVNKKFRTFQWHHDSFDTPQAAMLLAYSDACPNQAFRVGRCAWGLQFHPEVTEGIIRDWCAWEHFTSAKTEELIQAFSRETAAYGTTARRLLVNFLRAAELL